MFIGSSQMHLQVVVSWWLFGHASGVKEKKAPKSS